MKISGKFTDAGISLHQKLSQGGTLVITKVEAGSGSTSATATSLSTPMQLLEKNPSFQDGDITVFPTDLLPSSASSSYILNEIGVYAKLLGEDEVLYQIYTVLPSIPIDTRDRSRLRFYLSEIASKTENIQVEVNPTAALTEADLSRIVGKYHQATNHPQGNLCIHKGALWVNTSGHSIRGSEPSTDYSVWNPPYCNKNLLDNSWFTVNQDDKDEYVFQSSAQNMESGFVFDRWHIQTHGTGTVYVKQNPDGTITINATGDARLTQRFDTPLPLNQNAVVSFFSKYFWACL